MKIDNLKVYLEEYSILFKQKYAYSQDFYSKTGAKVEYFIIPDTRDKFVGLIKTLNASGLSYKVLGGGTNTLFLDSVTYSIFISTKLLSAIVFSSKYVTVEAGKETADFVRELFRLGITGYEGLEGIPGTVGGAVFMNAGAYGYEISDNLISVDVIDEYGNCFTLDKAYIEFSERSSLFQTKYSKLTILSLKFELRRGCYNRIQEKVSKFHVLRHSSLEYCFPNLGSVFALPTSDIYRKVKYPKYVEFAFKVFYKIYYSRLNYFFRNRRNPDKTVFNKFVFSFYPELRKSDIASPKTINTFVNKSSASIAIIRHIDELHRSVGRSVEIENELVISPVLHVNDYSDFNESMELYKRIKGIV
jgi:UDP-N-acetylmuramate dehydrogenase